MMKKLIITTCCAVLISMSLLTLPAAARAQETSEGAGAYVPASILFSIFHVPFKLVTCVGTQVTAAGAYIGTFGVPGHYDGGTNGRDIGETARKSCTGDWVIKPSQIKADYGS
jgi:hypothetical protein